MAGTVLGLSFSPVAWGQDGVPLGKKCDESAVCDAIIGAETKRGKVLEGAAVTITVVPRGTLERGRIRDPIDLQSVAASLSITRRQSTADTSIYIRGLGNGANNIGVEPLLGWFVDGVSEFGGNLEASYGNYNAVTAKAMLTGPIGRDVTFSIASGLNKREGIVRDLDMGGENNDRNRWLSRGQLLWDNRDGLKVRLILDYGKIDENYRDEVNLQKSLSTSAIFAFDRAISAPGETLSNVEYSNFPSSNVIENWGASSQFDYEFDGLHLTSITTYRITKADSKQDVDYSSADILGRHWKLQQKKKFSQEFRVSFATAKKISGSLGAYYVTEKADQANDSFWGADAREYADYFIRTKSQAVSIGALETAFNSQGSGNYLGRFFAQGTGMQERNTINGESFSFFGKIDFEITNKIFVTSGVRYTHESKSFWSNAISTDAFSQVFSKNDINSSDYAQVRSTLLYLSALSQGYDKFGAAIYAGNNVNNPAANPLVGLKALQYFPPLSNLSNAAGMAKVHDGNISYVVGVVWEMTRSVNAYATWSTGYRSPSIGLSWYGRPMPVGVPGLRGLGEGFDTFISGGHFASAENVSIYEIGVKGNWRNIYANINFFRRDASLIKNGILNGQAVVSQADEEGAVVGAEFEGAFRPVEPLKLSLSWTYLNFDNDTYRNSVGLPPLSMTVGGEVMVPVGARGGRLIMRGDYHYEAFKLAEGLPNLLARNTLGNINGMAIPLAVPREFKQEVNDVNVSVTYEMSGGLELSLWARNLLNDRNILQIFEIQAQRGAISGYANQPRTYGIAARYKF